MLFHFVPKTHEWLYVHTWQSTKEAISYELAIRVRGFDVMRKTTKRKGKVEKRILAVKDTKRKKSDPTSPEQCGQQNKGRSFQLAQTPHTRMLKI